MSVCVLGGEGVGVCRRTDVIYSWGAYIVDKSFREA